MGEEYNGNIFFSEDKTHDFITSITPGVNLFYRPSPGSSPIFTANLSSPMQIYARETEQTNFGENISFDTGYTYNYSRRLSFHLSDRLQRLGETRTQSSIGQLRAATPSLPSQSPPVGVAQAVPLSRQGSGLVSTGDTISNFFSAQTRFDYTRSVTITGRYSMAYENFIDEGGSETTNTVGARGVYKWRQKHNLHAGYSVRIIDSRNGDNDVVHNYDIGDDYFSDFKVKLDPTTTLSASTGIGFSTRGGNPRVVNNLNLTLIKIWRTAQFTAGVRRGLTGSLGVSGLSTTTTAFTNFNSRITRDLTGNVGANFSYFDTDDVDFNTFRASAELQYSIKRWLSTTLRYIYAQRNGGSGADSTVLRTEATIRTNSILLSLTANFDLWPNLGLAKPLPSP